MSDIVSVDPCRTCTVSRGSRLGVPPECVLVSRCRSDGDEDVHPLVYTHTVTDERDQDQSDITWIDQRLISENEIFVWDQVLGEILHEVVRKPDEIPSFFVVYVFPTSVEFSLTFSTRELRLLTL